MRKLINLVEDTRLRDMNLDRYWWTEDNGLMEVEWPTAHADVFIEYLRDRNESLGTDDYDHWIELDKAISNVDDCIEMAVSYGWVRISVSKSGQLIVFIDAYDTKFAQGAALAINDKYNYIDELTLKIRDKNYSLTDEEHIDKFLKNGRIIRKR